MPFAKGADPNRYLWTARNAPRMGGKPGRKRRLDRVKVMLEGEQIALANWREIVAKIVQAALEGSPFAQRLLADRIWPTMPPALVQQQILMAQAVQAAPGVSGGDTTVE